ncbi:MTH1187 family thiamine-binding protein [bacterium]|nr:MTH1187 family thiamine-binding protein [bacterium]MBU1919539.1 MTH1187 family thiamine-binding protein [bacterium]
MAIFAISVAPSGVEGTSVSQYVAAAQKVLAADSRVKHQLGPMFTTIEGPLDACFEVCQKMHEALIEMGAPRVGTVIKIDDRRDKVSTMESKLESVRSKMK